MKTKRDDPSEHLDMLLEHAHQHGEAVLYIPPKGFELIANPKAKPPQDEEDVN